MNGTERTDGRTDGRRSAAFEWASSTIYHVGGDHTAWRRPSSTGAMHAELCLAEASFCVLCTRIVSTQRA